MEVSAVRDVGTIVVAELQRLTLCQGNCGCRSYTRIPLQRAGTQRAIQLRATAEPKIAVERNPQPGLKVVTQMPFKGADWALGLSVEAG